MTSARGNCFDGGEIRGLRAALTVDGLFNRRIMDRKTTLAAAALAALAMASGCAHTMAGPQSTAAAKGECSGVNSCKGKGECGGAGHECAGQNACKGQGWISLTQSDCEAQHGTFKKG
jgi:uncharacterized membrane protein